jgi:hypothetical protein
MNATGKDDPALAETSWPMPNSRQTGHRRAFRRRLEDRAPPGLMGVAHRLAWGTADADDMAYAATVLAAYRALICDGTTARQIGRLAALRRVWRKRNAP